MRPEPPIKRATVLVDGQNLFQAVRDAFGYTFPNYDVSALSAALCARQGWVRARTRFSTGVPNTRDDPRWHGFWADKLGVMGREGVVVVTRPLRYRDRVVRLPDGSEHTLLTPEEKGIDVRIALDAIAGAHRGEYDVALVLSQDQDLSEVAEEIRAISREQGRWIKMASAYPVSAAASNRRGINQTDWIPIERSLYDSCLDRRDYLRRAGRL